MRIKIAELRLAPGQVGFYDELTNIHLTLTRPFASVYQGMNTSRLQQSVNSGRLILVSGSLRPAPVKASEEVAVEPVVAKAKTAPAKKEETLVEEPAVEVKAAEVKVEETAEVAVETLAVEAETVEEVETEEAPKAKKRTSKKKEVEE